MYGFDRLYNYNKRFKICTLAFLTPNDSFIDIIQKNHFWHWPFLLNSLIQNGYETEWLCFETGWLCYRVNKYLFGSNHKV